MSTFAARTTVAVHASQAEIKLLLRQHGATEIAFLDAETAAGIEFQFSARKIRFLLPLPQLPASVAPPRYRTAESRAWIAYEQAVRTLWRALLLLIKAKLVGIAAGVTTEEDELLPRVVMPDGKTVRDHVAPWVRESYAGRMPALPAFATRKALSDELA